MSHTHDEIERAAKRFNPLVDELDPATNVDSIDEVLVIAAASDAARSDDAWWPRESVEVDYVLAHFPEFVDGRKAADERFARGQYGERLDDVLAELDGEDSASV